MGQHVSFIFFYPAIGGITISGDEKIPLMEVSPYRNVGLDDIRIG